MVTFIEEIVYQVTGKSGLTMETDFVKDLELNSFDIMNIICAFEDKLDIVIPVREVWKMQQVKDVVAYLEEKEVSIS
ncbi:MAG: acyl carrier protein [Christensenellaceae bacterium]|jgi:acyl carrier protein